MAKDGLCGTFGYVVTDSYVPQLVGAALLGSVAVAAFVTLVTLRADTTSAREARGWIEEYDRKLESDAARHRPRLPSLRWSLAPTFDGNGGGLVVAGSFP